MNNTIDTNSSTLECDLADDLGYDLVPMYRTLFGISCVTVPVGALLNIVFVIALVARAKKVFEISNHALLLSCLAQVPLAVLQGPIRIYFYYHQGCRPMAGTSLCEVTVYLDYIPTQINNFLIAQLSIERFFLVVKPFIFHRVCHQSYSPAIRVHYVGLFVAIVFPCLYYPIIMQNEASTIDLDDPSATQTCDLWYARDIYEIFDVLITIVPYFIILSTCLSVIGVISYRRCVVGGRQGQRVVTRRQRRLLLSLNFFLLWFVVTWSPWVLYDFFQTVLNLTYSVYIDAITTFIVYLNYTFSSTIVLFTFKELRQFCLNKVSLQSEDGTQNHARAGQTAMRGTVGPVQTAIPSRAAGQTRIVGYGTEGRRIAFIS